MRFVGDLDEVAQADVIVDREAQSDIARAWRHILSQVSSYADLEPALLGSVEQLIDFVTVGSD